MMSIETSSPVWKQLLNVCYEFFYTKHPVWKWLQKGMGGVEFDNTKVETVMYINLKGFKVKRVMEN